MSLEKAEKLGKEARQFVEKYLKKVDKTTLVLCLVIYFLLRKEAK